MAGKSAILTVKILTDASAAGKGIDAASGKFAKFQSGISKLTPAAVAVAGGLAAFGTKAVSAASDVQQAMGGLDAVFGKNAGTVKKWAADGASAVGLSKAEYGNFATVIGSQLKNAGLPMDQVMDKTNSLISLGADLAATYGGTTAEAVDALSAALKGEFDPMERYGATLSASAISAKMAADGTDKLTGKAAQQGKALATLSLITGQTTDAQGQFARESDTLAGQQQIANATFQNAAADLGAALLPAITAVTSAFAGMATWVSQNATLVTVLAGVVGGLAAGILAVNIALKAYKATATAVAAVQRVMQAAALGTRIQLAALAVQQRVTAAATKVAAVAQRLFNAAIRANPVGILITVIMLAVAAVVALWKKNKTFRDFVKGAWKAIATVAKAAWNGIKRVVMSVLNWISTKIKQVKSVVSAAWSAMKSAGRSAWSGIKSVVSGVVNWIKSAIRATKTVVNAVWSAIKSAASTTWRGIKAVVSGVINGIKSIISGVRSTAIRVWNSIKNAARTAFNAILGPVRAVQSAFDRVVSVVRNVIGWIGRIKFPSPPKWLSKIIPGGKSATRSATYGYTVSAAPAAASPMAFAAGGLAGGRRLAATAGGPSIVINVSGTLNDTDSARAVRRVLRNDSRRRGGVIIDRRRQEVRS